MGRSFERIKLFSVTGGFDALLVLIRAGARESESVRDFTRVTLVLVSPPSIPPSSTSRNRSDSTSFRLEQFRTFAAFSHLPCAESSSVAALPCLLCSGWWLKRRSPVEGEVIGTGSQGRRVTSRFALGGHRWQGHSLDARYFVALGHPREGCARRAPGRRM